MPKLTFCPLGNVDWVAPWPRGIVGRDDISVLAFDVESIR